MGIAYQIRDQEGLYFLTLQVVGWVDIFTRKIYRDIVVDSLDYCRKNKGLEIFAYVIMSNHIHLVVRHQEGDLSGVLRDFKRHTAREILDYVTESNTESRKEWMQMVFNFHARHNAKASQQQFWTHANHAVELYGNKMIDSRLNYIHENPVRAGIVRNAEDYLYSSAVNYADLDAIIEIDNI